MTHVSVAVLLFPTTPLRERDLPIATWLLPRWFDTRLFGFSLEIRDARFGVSCCLIPTSPLVRPQMEAGAAPIEWLMSRMLARRAPPSPRSSNTLEHENSRFLNEVGVARRRGAASFPATCTVRVLVDEQVAYARGCDRWTRCRRVVTSIARLSRASAEAVELWASTLICAAKRADGNLSYTVECFPHTVAVFTEEGSARLALAVGVIRVGNGV
ncbi:hypothetical protein EXIGLDRAFT_763741 [Exidia glandulosa HHB12029]|uniref:Uncharacterized protein n=1 Tax=Exidia glandulosa HHB12029 TaxID=1314781 RepID=A0A165LSD5_EXIGL|nr:hypothetical protein EXIGLDRAFT_763741 [Exidia glandulosa HHB12029]